MQAAIDATEQFSKISTLIVTIVSAGSKEALAREWEHRADIDKTTARFQPFSPVKAT